MKWIKHDPRAILPIRHSEGAAGYDLHALDSGIIFSNGAHIRTGVGVIIPDGYVGLIRDRSGLARKHGIATLAGVIDSDYRGEVVVIVAQLAKFISAQGCYEYRSGERIAQLVIVPCVMESSEWADDVPHTERGSNGFGSSGA